MIIDRNQMALSYVRSMGESNQSVQQLARLLSQIKIDHPSIYEICKNCETYDEAFYLYTNYSNDIKMIAEIKQQKIKSNNILLIPYKGVRINNRSYEINFLIHIKNNKILDLLYQKRYELFSLHEGKHLKFKQISNWQGSFFNYYEFLLQMEVKTISKNQILNFNKCNLCDQPLYPLNDPQFSTKILTQLESVSDNDAIIFNGCNHPVHINCFKNRVQLNGNYKCTCGTEYQKSIECKIKGQEISEKYSDFIKITYDISDQVFNNQQIPSQQKIAYLYSINKYSRSIYYAYEDALNRGLTFKVEQNLQGEPQLKFNIRHLIEKPSAFTQAEDFEFKHEVEEQFESYNIQLKQEL